MLTRVLLVGLGLLGLGLTALGLYVSSLEVGVLREPIAGQLARALGREVSIGRVVEWGELLRPRLVLEEVVVRSSPEEGGVELARVERAIVGLDLLALLGGGVHVESVRTEGVSLTIDVDREGHWIWAARGMPAGGNAAGGLEVEIDDVDVEGARIRYRDARTGETADLGLDHLSLSLEPGRVELEIAGELSGTPFALEASFVPKGDPRRLSGPFEARAEGSVRGMPVELEGEVGTLLELGELDLALRVRDIELPVPRELLGGLALGPATLDGRLQARDGALALRQVRLASAAPGQDVLKLTGAVEDLAGSTEVDFQLVFEGRGRAVLGLFVDQAPEIFERLRLTGRVHGRGSRLALDDGVLELGEGEGASLRIEGGLEDVLGMRTVDARLRVDLPDATSVLPALERATPSLRGTARLESVGSSLRLEDLEATLEVGASTLELRGAVEGSPGALELELDASLRAPDLATLGRWVDRELPALGPVKGSAHLRGNARDVDAEAIDVEIGGSAGARLRVVGEARDLAGDADAHLRVSLAAPSTGALEPLVERALPELGRVEALASVDASRRGLRVEGLSLSTRRDDGLSLALEGELHGAALGDEADLTFVLESPDLPTLGALVETSLPELAPVRASGRLYASRDGSFQIHALDARLGGSDLRGSIGSTVAQGRRRLVAELAAERLVLRDFLPGPTAGSDPGEIWDRDLPVLPLPELDLELILRARSLEARTGLQVEDLALRAVLEAGLLTLSSLGFELEAAPVELSAGLDTRESLPRVWLRGSGDEIDLAAVAAQFTEQKVVSGRARLRADLSAHGRTPSALVASLGGDVSVALREGRLATDAAVLLQKHVLQALTFKGTVPDDARARCVVADFALESGVARTRTLLVGGEHAILHGQGSIDLETGTLDLLLTPKATSPRLFAVYVPVSVTGRYDDPVARPLRRSLASTAAVAFVGNLLVPGVGLMAPFVKVGQLGGDPCSEAVAVFLGEALPAEDTASAAPAR